MTSKRILLVIDDKLLLKLYQEKLEENGFAVSAVRDMGKAAQALADKKPDLVLLDVVFQEGNPVEFIQAIRADSANAVLPILLAPNLLDQVGNPTVKQKLIENTESALAQGIFGAPSFLVQPHHGPKQLYFGQDRLLFVEKALERGT